MIAKRVPIKSGRKSSFAKLANYISNPQEKSERVGVVSVSNCHSTEIEDAALEVMATQARNTRSTSDKTYHLLISFRAGEQPPAQVLAEIEQRICAGLGFAEHQRVSAVHHDTDNLHIHIAINKIHPVRLTLHEPFRDYRTLGELCTALETEYGLEQDNHQARKSGAENRAADMEHSAGVESLIGWVKRECLEQIQRAQTWQSLHQVMHEHGLTLHLRGNGLVISDQAGTTIKASSASRDLSKAKLQERLGSFEASPEQQPNTQPKRSYQAKPMRSRMDTTELYARYKTEQLNNAAACSAARTKAHERKAQNIAAAKRSGAMKRAALKLVSADRLAKKALYALINQTLKNEINKAHQRYLQERQMITSQHKPRTWNDWLQHKAMSGDQQALAALRARAPAQSLKGNTVSGRHTSVHAPLKGLDADSVTKKGTLIYRTSGSAIRDDGHALKVSQGAAVDDLAIALQLAMQRFGQTLTVNGTTEFKQQVASVAAARRLAVQFDDPELEQTRLALLADTRLQSRKSRSSGIHR